MHRQSQSACPFVYFFPLIRVTPVSFNGPGLPATLGKLKRGRESGLDRVMLNIIAFLVLEVALGWELVEVRARQAAQLVVLRLNQG